MEEEWPDISVHREGADFADRITQNEKEGTGEQGFRARAPFYSRWDGMMYVWRRASELCVLMFWVAGTWLLARGFDGC
jgi:hypothetical protein